MSLRLQLHWEVYTPIISPHPFFFQLGRTDSQALLEICHMTISEQFCWVGAELFSPGQAAKHMYFIRTGCADYMRPCDNHPIDILPGFWFSEVALWLKWDHVGCLTALKACELIAINGDKFRNCARRF